MIGGRGMGGGLVRAIGRLPSSEQAKAAGVICFAVGNPDGKFVIIGRQFDILPNAAAVLEAEPEIVCAVRVALLGCAPIEFPGKRQMFVNTNAALQANPKTVLCRRISLFSRQAKVFGRAVQILANASAVLQAAPEIEERVGVRKRCRPPIVRNGAVKVPVDAVAALEAAAEAVYTVRIASIGRFLEALGSGGEIDGNAAAGL
jgi:hypothetical protein